MPIHAWPKFERPRERLLAKGVETLSDAELLAVLLRTGVKGKDAVSLARELLAKSGGLRRFLAEELKTLKGEKGLGSAKIATLLAATEIARRALRQEIIGKNVIRDPESVLNYLYASMRDRKKEVFKVLFLDKANRVIDEVDLFHGTIDETAIHPRESNKAYHRKCQAEEVEPGTIGNGTLRLSSREFVEMRDYPRFSPFLHLEIMIPQPSFLW